MKNKLLSGLVVIFFLSIFTTSALAASVYTDKTDYSPNEIVIITGEGFIANHFVWLTIVTPSGYTYHPTSHTNSSGIFVYSFTAGLVYGTYNITATDGTSSASTTFTDAAVFSITITSPVAGSVSSPVRVYGTWSVSNNPPGLLIQYNVQIVWGDGNKNDVVNIDRNDNGQSGSNQVFSGTFDTQPISGCSGGDDNCNAGTFDHTYSGCGPFTITAKLYHASVPGNEQTGDSSATVTITISNCQTTTTTTTTTIPTTTTTLTTTTTTETTSTTTQTTPTTTTTTETTSTTTLTTTTTPTTTTTTQTTPTTTTTTTQPPVKAPTAIGPWPYFVILSIIAVAAWRLGPMFAKNLSVKLKQISMLH